MESIPAIYEGGVFRPTVPVDLAEGVGVDVIVPKQSLAERRWGDGIHLSAGSLADRPELDADLQAILAARQLDSRRGLAE